MEYVVVIKRKVLKTAAKMPFPVQQKLTFLLDDLREKGPVRKEWPNYSKLGKNEHHCHLGYKWAACWRVEPGTIMIEVYYAGSRENAPY